MKTIMKPILERIDVYRIALYRASVIVLSMLVTGCEISMDSDSQTDPIASAKSKTSENMPPAFPDDPAAFVPEITNPYVAFERGKIFYYEEETDEGLETINVKVTHENKMILGVATTVVHDQVYLNGELIEDTFDWFAQDVDGNVWYFGEDSREFEDGVEVSNEGSWEAGVYGALPGLLMPAHPKNGMKYRQEFAEGEAEDMAIIISTNKTVVTELGVFEGCVETMDYSPLEPGHREHKYYHPGTGLALETKPGVGRVELIAVTNN